MSNQPRCAFIVKMYSGPIVRYQLREVGTMGGRVLYSAVEGPGVETWIRRAAAIRGFVVEDGVRVEDWRRPGTWGRPARTG